MSLFGKGPRPAEDQKPAAPQPPAAPSVAASFFHAHKTEARNAVIGPNVRIQGELSGDEDITIEGKVEGKITVTKAVKIGAGAQVNAEISAQSVVVAGRVVGNVTAVERVEILPTGVLEGNIRAPKIAIAEGATFKGSVDMGSKSAPTGGASPASAVPAAAGLGDLPRK